MHCSLEYIENAIYRVYRLIMTESLEIRRDYVDRTDEACDYVILQCFMIG